MPRAGLSAARLAPTKAAMVVPQMVGSDNRGIKVFRHPHPVPPGKNRVSEILGICQPKYISAQNMYVVSLNWLLEAHFAQNTSDLKPIFAEILKYLKSIFAEM